MDAAASATAMVAAAVAILAAAVASLPVLRRLFVASEGNKTKRRRPLPPGSFGMPVVGQMLSYLRALRANAAEEWFSRRAAAYGPVSRLSLFSCPTAFVAARPPTSSCLPAPTKSPESMARMIGRRTIRDVSGDEHRTAASGP
ncbi:hypothetical protein BAE44_0015875 [Dichanthelium oligosanthes]|uniref:Uncharacterized protein n=1 Tax=Dichanthelium oligosanthes TaxID=888268 RepID=A0A1E5VDI4_9POAL|nr:hypothetical protein BAE44_0015875 [Dichanthelium oligosanthes]